MKVENLSYTYPGKQEPTLRDVSFSVKEGEVTGLFGPNGSGKTTLLKCMTGFNKVRSGRVLLEGDLELSGLTVREKSRMISFVPQELTLNMPFTVREVVMMGLESYTRSMYRTEDDERKTDEVIRDFGLEDISDEYFTELSGGQKQLISVARAVNQRSKYLFLDEPVSNLDFSNAHGIWKKLRQLNGQGMTVVISSHDPNHILKYCDRVVLVNKGRVVDSGSPSEMLTREHIQDMFGMVVRRETVGDTDIILPEG